MLQLAAGRRRFQACDWGLTQEWMRRRSLRAGVAENNPNGIVRVEMELAVRDAGPGPASCYSPATPTLTGSALSLPQPPLSRLNRELRLAMDNLCGTP